MATRRAIKGVLRNFLGTYVSRYSEYSGYWLFGFLVQDLNNLLIQLLDPGNVTPDDPLGVALASAPARFAEQLQKAGVNRAHVEQAQLTIARLAYGGTCWINGQHYTGATLRFRAEAVMDDGKLYSHERDVVVAKHDPSIEYQSMRAR